MIQKPLFKNEKIEDNVQKIDKMPRPVVKIRLDNLNPIGASYPHKEEVKRIFDASDKRIFLPESDSRELLMISDGLVGELKKIGESSENLEAMTNIAVQMLAIQTNLYSTQAIKLAASKVNAKGIWGLTLSPRKIKQ